MSRKKELFYSSIKNIIAVALPTIILQLLILPQLAKRVSIDHYGLIVTLVSILNFIATRTGNTLNNVRLLYHEEYRITNNQQDFAALVLLFGLVSCSITLFLGHVYAPTEFNYILFIITAIVMFSKEYYVVYFRLSLDYNAILFSYAIQVVGLLLGWALVCRGMPWLWIYFLGYGLALAYVIIKNKAKPCRLRKVSARFKHLLHAEVILFITSIFNGFNVYADKLIILPLLGGELVAIYYVATLVGKLLDMLVSPTASALLSYLVKENRFAIKNHLKILALIAFLAYILCLAISPSFLRIIYPKYGNEVLRYLKITIATGIINSLYTIINVFLLRIHGAKTQLVTSIPGTAIFVISSIYFGSKLGLMGFCMGAMFASLMKTILAAVILLNHYKEEI